MSCRWLLVHYARIVEIDFEHKTIQVLHVWNIQYRLSTGAYSDGQTLKKIAGLATKNDEIYVYPKRDFSTTKHLVDLRPVCKVRFVHCGPLEERRTLYQSEFNHGSLTKFKNTIFPVAKSFTNICQNCRFSSHFQREVKKLPYIFGF